MTMTRNDYILTISCPDAKGIVYRVSGFLFDHGCNILDSAQFGDEDTGLFFLRLHFDLAHDQDRDQFQAEFQKLATSLQMTWNLTSAATRTKVTVLVSRHGHCLNDLLFRFSNDLLPIDIVGVVSNHPDFQDLVEHHNIPFHLLPVSAENKAEQEARLLDILQSSKTDLVVLARYMQVLSASLCQKLAGRAINIHHSFLPSFKGAKPYAQAHARGVKIIGATAHYVTTELDEGPIIEQDIERVDHAMNADELSLIGGDIESRVLSRAVKWHAERRILLNGNKTVVFR
jgi:formyltetrahydrofolate deformylase